MGELELSASEHKLTDQVHAQAKVVANASGRIIVVEDQLTKDVTKEDELARNLSNYSVGVMASRVALDAAQTELNTTETRIAEIDDTIKKLKAELERAKNE